MLHPAHGSPGPAARLCRAFAIPFLRKAARPAPEERARAGQLIAFVPGYRPGSTAKFVSAGSGRDKTASLNRALAGTRAKWPGEKALTSEFSR
jgi:hypothetical protein